MRGGASGWSYDESTSFRATLSLLTFSLRWPIQTLPCCIVYCIDTIQSALYRLVSCTISIQAGGATCEDREGLPADEQPPLLPSLVPGMSFTAQCTPSSRASGASSALGLPKPLCLKRKGVDLAHACDTANHSIVCVCFSCCGWKPNETALAADPGKLEERYVWVLEREVNGTSNVRWIAAWAAAFRPPPASRGCATT